MKSNASYAWLLVAIFFISFAIPLTFAAKISGAFSSTSYSDDIFPGAFNVLTPERTLEVLDSQEINPAAGSDFIISTWFQLTKFPKAGDRAIFLSKYDSSDRSKAGFALAVSRTADAIRPEIYWKGQSKKSGWYTFSQVNLVPGQWYHLVISFYNGKYLGLHGHTYDPKSSAKPKLLGGYELKQETILANGSNLFIGSLGAKNFRGRIGPTSIVKFSNLRDSFDNMWQIFKASDPLSILDKDQVLLWIENNQDKSQNNYKLKIKGGKARTKSSKKS
ncbi:MAG: hypothetical protein R3A13_09695 [Bdellovibrionota bacterium]